MKEGNSSNKKTISKESETIEEIVGQDEETEIKESEKEPTKETVINKDVTEENDETVTGIVIDCSCLALRSEPSFDSYMAAIIDVGTEIEVNESQSTDEFYHVTLSNGKTGFCKKSFIKIK